MSILEDRLPWLDHITLAHGAHSGPNGAACVMEAVAWVAGEPWSDHPECASPVMGAFLRNWNDNLDDTDRQMLKPYVTRLVGTRGTRAQEEERAWMATDWLARECAPAFLRLAGLTAQAELLEALAPLTSTARAQEAQPTLDQARKESAAARGAAAGAAAWAAAGDAAGDAAGAAARAAAWAAAGDAARAAARAAARGAAAGAAAWAAAWDAAWAAARDAAGDAARDAARDALAPTVQTLQASALLLLERMIAVTKEQQVA